MGDGFGRENLADLRVERHRTNLLPIGRLTESGRCLAGESSQRSPDMLYVWWVDRPTGPFSSSMYIDPERFPAMLGERGETW